VCFKSPKRTPTWILKFQKSSQVFPRNTSDTSHHLRPESPAASQNPTHPPGPDRCSSNASPPPAHELKYHELYPEQRNPSANNAHLPEILVMHLKDTLFVLETTIYSLRTDHGTPTGASQLAIVYSARIRRPPIQERISQCDSAQSTQQLSRHAVARKNALPLPHARDAPTLYPGRLVRRFRTYHSIHKQTWKHFSRADTRLPHSFRQHSACSIAE
jgi:hypothetical protein